MSNFNYIDLAQYGQQVQSRANNGKQADYNRTYEEKKDMRAYIRLSITLATTPSNQIPQVQKLQFDNLTKRLKDNNQIPCDLIAVAHELNMDLSEQQQAVLVLIQHGDNVVQAPITYEQLKARIYKRLTQLDKSYLIDDKTSAVIDVITMCITENGEPDYNLITFKQYNKMIMRLLRHEYQAQAEYYSPEHDNMIAFNLNQLSKINAVEEELQVLDRVQELENKLKHANMLKDNDNITDLIRYIIECPNQKLQRQLVSAVRAYSLNNNIEKDISLNTIIIIRQHLNGDTIV